MGPRALFPIPAILLVAGAMHCGRGSPAHEPRTDEIVMHDAGAAGNPAIVASDAPPLGDADGDGAARIDLRHACATLERPCCELLLIARRCDPSLADRYLAIFSGLVEDLGTPPNGAHGVEYCAQQRELLLKRGCSDDTSDPP